MRLLLCETYVFFYTHSQLQLFHRRYVLSLFLPVNSSLLRCNPLCLSAVVVMYEVVVTMKVHVFMSVKVLLPTYMYPSRMSYLASYLQPSPCGRSSFNVIELVAMSTKFWCLMSSLWKYLICRSGSVWCSPGSRGCFCRFHPTWTRQCQSRDHPRSHLHLLVTLHLYS